MATRSPHVVLIAPGAKMGLARALAMAVEKRAGRLTAWEHDPCAPAAACCRFRSGGQLIETADAAEALLQWCGDSGVNLVVPSRHDDLPALASARGQFEAAGVSVAVSAAECIQICLDKRKTWAWLKQQGFPVPEQSTVADRPHSALREALPLVAKCPTGSGSRQIRHIRREADLETVPKDWIIQPVATGTEYTVNVYIDRKGVSVCEIPHARILVRDGEVIRARTTKNTTVMTLARSIAERLPGARGPINIQMFQNADDDLPAVIDINPRFGGGYPLADRAGGHFAEWLLSEYIDGRRIPRFDAWENNLLMVRYREAIFHPSIPVEGKNQADALDESTL